MELVVVESPSKAKTISKYLGKGYIVKASKGHVVDLPKSQLGIDVENNFEPQYVVTKEASLKEIKKAYKESDSLILAVDLDREGEAIGWHIASELGAVAKTGAKKKSNKPVKRIVFSEITKDAIQDAIKSPRAIDMDLVDAQQARRLLDRLVGYKLSPLLWKKIQFGLSAGRVQSVALRLVVEREEERDRFKKDEYWSVESLLNTKDEKGKVKELYKLSADEPKKYDEVFKEYPKHKVKFDLFKIDNKKPNVVNKVASEKIIDDVKGEKWIISDVTRTETKRNPKPPFITSTLQQTAANVFGFTAKRTMTIAQKLYEAGLITYMRTDSVNMSAQAANQAIKYIKNEFGDKYLPEKATAYKSSNKSAQEAHECIRPSDFFTDESSMEADAAKLFRLIKNRALGSLMRSAEVENLGVTVDIKKYQFKATGSRILFDGYLKATKDTANEKLLPDLKKGQELFLEVIAGIQHFTEPPARYSEATLIKKLEELGIGRPSTYASIISTIIDRKYTEKEGAYLKPTDVGKVVNALLTKYFGGIVDYDFTREMEEKLDKVAEGKQDWRKMLADFYFPFEKEVQKQDKEIPRKEFTELGTSDEKCPECGKDMVVKLSRYGKFLSCTDYPKCKGMRSLAADGVTAEPEVLTIDTEKFEGAPQTEDKRDFILRKSQYGLYWGHPDYPKVKEYLPILLKEKCPECGSNLVERKGKWGKTFIGCSSYPKCKYIQKTEIVKS